MFFRCKHPFASLAADREAKITQIDGGFERVDYHFLCTNCSERLTHKHVRCIGGVDAFLARAPKRGEGLTTNASGC